METILSEWVTRRHVVPPMQEYLVRWKGLQRRKAIWEREDVLGQVLELDPVICVRGIDVVIDGMVGESVTPSFCWTYPHMGRIRPLSQMSPSRPYLKR